MKEYKQLLFDELSKLLLWGATPLLLISFSRIFTEGFLKVMILHAFLFLLFLFNTFYVSKKSSLTARINLITIFYLIGIGAVFNTKNIIAGVPDFIIAMILTSLWFEYKYVVINFCMIILSEFLISIFYLEKIELVHIFSGTAFTLIALKAVNVVIQALEESKDQESKAKVEITKNLKEKELYFSFMTHELRTPLVGSLNGIELLSETKLESSQKDLVKTIEYSNNLLLSLVNDLLDFGKLNENKIEINKKFIDINASLDDFLAPHILLCKQKKLEFQIDINISNEYLYSVDEKRIFQVLNNLIGNSIKFTANGSVNLTVNYHNNHLVFMVKDSGIGIDEEKIPTLFNPYEQASKEIQASFGGTGLGLAISKKLIELMSGTIKVESKLGLGSIFTIEIPADQTKNIIQIEENKTEAFCISSDLNLNVLIVDDNSINQKILTLMLNKFNINCTVANNGREAIALFQANSFDIVFMDINMPILNGNEASQKIKSINQQAFIVAISSNTPDENSIAFYNSVLLKPFSKTMLTEVLRHYLTKQVKI